MRFFLGIDGGQSSTTAVIGNEHGHIIGYGRGGPCNHVKTGDGREKFVNAILGCVGQAEREAGLQAPRYQTACAGFSGGPADKDALLREIVPADSWSITNDALIALVGATGGESGVIVIAGTGSIAYGRNHQGRVARAGGWGYVFGDEGGGFDLTRQALRAALRQHEGWGPATVLHDRLLKETGATDANELLHQFYTAEYPRPKIAALSRLVDEAASDGDQEAVRILEEAAAHLARYADAVRTQLFAPAEAAFIVPIGGAWHSSLLRARFQSLAESTPGNHCGHSRFGPAAGALLEAYRMAGITVQVHHHWPDFVK